MEIIRSTQFKRDFKKVRNNPSKVDLFKQALMLILSGEPLPDTYNEHPLKGDKVGFTDIHLAPDFILIYRIDKLKAELHLARIGSHSDLFK
jgi:mRNA interferase YafQ